MATNTIIGIPSFCAQQWSWPIQGPNSTIITDSFSQENLAFVDSTQVDMQQLYQYARSVGVKELKKLTFLDKSRILKKMALYLLERKEELYAMSKSVGSNRLDSWIDIEGGIGTFFTYAGLLKKNLPEQTIYYENPVQNLNPAKGNQFIGRHINVPKGGVAIHINAFNFPVWGMLEKLATCWSAGMPAIVKPASSSCHIAQKCVEMMIESNILPPGILSLISGSIGKLLNFVDYQDVVTFTGSLEVGLKIKNHPKMLSENITFNMETDSLNASILAPCKQDDPCVGAFIKEILREVCTKAGQKCTAIRRVFVPENSIPWLKDLLIKQFETISIGDSDIKGIKLGPLINSQQKHDVLKSIELLKSQGVVWHERLSVPEGSFVGPTLLYFPDANSTLVHSIEPFGPVCSIIPYSSVEDLSKKVQLGRGSLVASIFRSFLETNAQDNIWIQQVTNEIAPHHGRILIIDKDCHQLSTGHGSPLPHLKHGGPGRAGGGAELGGLHGLTPYFQKVALQGSPTTVSTICGDFIVGQQTPNDPHDIHYVHPFRKHFEMLEVGETLITHRRTITQADITNFAGVSGDNFYAHTDEIAAKNSIFEKRVAHGYFLLSAAAGLFVYPGVGPVIANYGLENLRFIKPVYPDDTIHVRLSVKEKMRKETNGVCESGVVVWDVAIINQNEEIVATYLVLTLVACQIKS